MDNLMEKRIAKTCEEYHLRGMAVIKKRPTPVKIVKKDMRGKIIEGWPDEKSTVDFEGISHGRSIAFECKSTKQKSFPLNNISEHQMTYLRDHLDQGGISFFLIEFSYTGEIFFVWYKQVEHWWKVREEGGRKSIPYNWLSENCDVVRGGRGVDLDFLYYMEKKKHQRSLYNYYSKVTVLKKKWDEKKQIKRPTVIEVDGQRFQLLHPQQHPPHAKKPNNVVVNGTGAE